MKNDNNDKKIITKIKSKYCILIIPKTFDDYILQLKSKGLLTSNYSIRFYNSFCIKTIISNNKDYITFLKANKSLTKIRAFIEQNLNINYIPKPSLKTIVINPFFPKKYYKGAFLKASSIPKTLSKEKRLKKVILPPTRISSIQTASNPKNNSNNK